MPHCDAERAPSWLTRLLARGAGVRAALSVARWARWARWDVRKALARGAVVVALLTLLAGPGSPLVGWAQAAQGTKPPAPFAGGPSAPWQADPDTPNRLTPGSLSLTPPAAAPALSPSATPTVTPAHPSFQPITRGGGVPMQPALVTLSATSGAHFVSSDGALEATVPAGAVSAADLRAATGKQLALRIVQTTPGSGSNAGGSGQVSLGSYLLQVVDGQGFLAAHGLR